MQEQVLSKIKKGIRNTNSFLPINIVKQKIDNKEVEIVEDNFFLGLIEKSEYDFSYLYFYIENRLEFDLKVLENKQNLIVDVIFSERKQKNWFPIINKFSECGFKKHTSFNRMALSNPSRIENYQSDKVVTATSEDLPLIKLFLEENFDVYAERIPTIKELEKLSETTYLIKQRNSIAAILISEINGYTEELRYWLVDKEYRENGFGSILMKYFFNHNASTTRFLLWVQENNENAIEKYKHFGFEKDNLNMYILKK